MSDELRVLLSHCLYAVAAAVVAFAACLPLFMPRLPRTPVDDEPEDLPDPAPCHRCGRPAVLYQLVGLRDRPDGPPRMLCPACYETEAGGP